MLSLILFILLIILGVYSYSTREKLIIIANHLDNLDLALGKALSEDRLRLLALELKHDKPKNSKKM